MCRYAAYMGLVSSPNKRSSHKLPTPVGGGVPLVCAFLFSVLLLFIHRDLADKEFIILIGGGLIIASVSFLDDLRSVPVLWRLLLHFFSVTAGVLLTGGLPPVQTGYLFLDLSWYGSVIIIFFLVWWLNLFNFMDGIDGIAGVETVSVVLSAVFIIHFCKQKTDTDVLLLILLMASVLGFLWYNWPPARIFMGDTGSTFTGYSLGMIALITNEKGLLSLWIWFILFSVFLVDATMTLLIRIVRGENIFKAHRNHAYQHIALLLAKNRGISGEKTRARAHLTVITGVAAINMFWLLPCAFFAALRPEWGGVIFGMAILPLVCCRVGLSIISHKQSI